jgi:hypothetical protein
MPPSVTTSPTPSGRCSNPGATRQPARAGPGSGRCGAWSTGSVTGSEPAVHGGTSPTGTARGGGCTPCSRAGSCSGCGAASRPLCATADSAGRLVVAGVGGLHHRPRPHPRRRRPPRQRGTRCGRTRSPRAGSLPRRVGHQDPRRGRPAPRGAGVPADPRPGRRQPTDDPRPGEIRIARPGAGRPRRRPERVLADKAYSSRANRAWLRAHRIAATIPVPADQAGHRRRRGSRGGRPPAFDPTPTRTGTPSSAASTTSNTTAGSPPATTSSPSATPPPSTSPASTTGSNDFRNRP